VTFRHARRRVLDWLTVNELPLPPEIHLDDRVWFGDHLDRVFWDVLRVVHLVPRQVVRPEDLTRPQQNDLVWAILYTMAHARREAHARELRADPMSPETFEAEMASM